MWNPKPYILFIHLRFGWDHSCSLCCPRRVFHIRLPFFCSPFFSVHYQFYQFVVFFMHFPCISPASAGHSDEASWKTYKQCRFFQSLCNNLFCHIHITRFFMSVGRYLLRLHESAFVITIPLCVRWPRVWMAEACRRWISWLRVLSGILRLSVLFP